MTVTNKKSIFLVLIPYIKKDSNNNDETDKFRTVQIFKLILEISRVLWYAFMDFGGRFNEY